MRRSKEISAYFNIGVRGLKMDQKLGINESGSAFIGLVHGFMERKLSRQEAIRLAKRAEKKAGFRRGK